MGSLPTHLDRVIFEAMHRSSAIEISVCKPVHIICSSELGRASRTARTESSILGKAPAGERFVPLVVLPRQR